ncbi:MAG: helix-turn-helix transcriptional regulator [Phycisphaerales bacterium]
MTKKDLQFGNDKLGAVLRAHRVDSGKGLRETAAKLGIAPAHLTDIEKGRRAPSEELLVKIARVYGIEEAELRSGWKKPETVVGEIASQDATTAAKVPEFLRTAKDLKPEQWDRLIKQAKKMSGEGGKQ